ncbi:LTA synthase family protein [Ferruginibacter sp.]|nr:sulfatase-like hydrolase/transferase [Ferruginibacter sp.]
MLFLQRIPRLLRWIFSVVILLLLTMTICRILFYIQYNPPQKAFSGSAFILGFRFDARIACIVGLAIMLLNAIPFLNPFKNAAAKKIWNILLPLIFTVLILFYFIDFYHFDYLHQRLNATVLNYLEDAGISFNMMWQTYPLIKVGIAIAVLLLLARFLFARLLGGYLQKDSFYKRKGIAFYIVTFFILGGFIFGKIGQFPLRWSDAFTLSDDFKANLALNPFQSFFSTLSFRNSTYDAKKVKEYYPLMAKYLAVQQPDSIQLNYERKYTVADSIGNKPNVVLVICESFSAYKSSMYGNPLNTTPYFNELCKNGIFFDRCFTPAYGTARGVWATITGIPDVESPSTASRNPNAVNQHTIINDFKGYNNYYFLGGSATWANIRGLLTNNINGLHLYEEQDYKAAKIDVWGISDKNLFLEANKVLKEQTKPFFAIIQTADNHRPYTIPKEDEAVFKRVSFSTDSLKKFGFESNEEMNAFRYTDFSYQQFMEAAKKEKYFDNTIFVFIGDHGIRGNAGDMFPKSWTEQGLTCEHVPLLFYAPKLLQPKRINEVCSQADILPTVASLVKTNYRNTTFGRNLFDTVPALQYKSILPKENFSFIIDHDAKTVGLISNQYYFLKNLKTGKENFVSMINNDPVQKTPATDSIKNYLSHLTDAYYETAKYLLLNNKKK